ncbi:MAG: hypothetical protein ABL953_05420 [Ilumatobacteraceae bacterium]
MSSLAILVVAQLAIFGLITLIAYARGGRNAAVAPPPSPNAQWATDPTGRHELRMFDGQRWTANISDRGVSGWDPLP